MPGGVQRSDSAADVVPLPTPFPASALGQFELPSINRARFGRPGMLPVATTLLLMRLPQRDKPIDPSPAEALPPTPRGPWGRLIPIHPSGRIKQA